MNRRGQTDKARGSSGVHLICSFNWSVERVTRMVESRTGSVTNSFCLCQIAAITYIYSFLEIWDTEKSQKCTETT